MTIKPEKSCVNTAADLAVRAAPAPFRVLFFSPARTNEGVRRHIDELLCAGCDVTMLSFWRDRHDKGAVRIPEGPRFRNVDLGPVSQQNLLRRFYPLMRGIGIALRHRKLLAGGDIVIARNMDMGWLALVAMKLGGHDVPLVYEVLDVQAYVTRGGFMAWLLRALEGVLLRRASLLVVSSPGFLRDYFQLYFPRLPRVALIENRLSFSRDFGPLPVRQPAPLDDAAPVWVIGYFGKLRCLRSLRLLVALARHRPDRVRIHIAGFASTFAQSLLLQEIEGIANIAYLGSYRSPDDLAALMHPLHLNWCLDLRQAKSAQILLPNRIYEGGYFAVPALGQVQTETGRYIQKHQLGFLLPRDLDIGQMLDFIDRLTPDIYRQVRAGLEAMPPAAFAQDGALTENLKQLAKPRQELKQNPI